MVKKLEILQSASTYISQHIRLLSNDEMHKESLIRLVDAITKDYGQKINLLVTDYWGTTNYQRQN